MPFLARQTANNIRNRKKKASKKIDFIYFPNICFILFFLFSLSELIANFSPKRSVLYVFYEQLAWTRDYTKFIRDNVAN